VVQVRSLAFVLVKPLPVIAALLWAARAGPLPSARYRGLFLAGLACGICGDVLLEFPGLFLPGLVAFLLGHLCYAVAFFSAGGRPRPGSLAGPLLFAAAAVIPLLPNLGALQLPVLCYVGAIAVMAGLAVDRFRLRRTDAAARAAVGAGLFLVSDAALAWARFGGAPLPKWATGLLVLGTYYAAQGLLASSVGCADFGTAGQETPAGSR
jgi:uncharacterized membrane protein YhhN